MRRVYLLPNLFTTASLFCGSLAILNVMQGELVNACWLIFLSFLLDGMDGKLARLTKTESRFGLNYDSLSDLVAFGVAPAVLVFHYCISENLRFSLAAGVATLYIICSALRLARFNIQYSRIERRRFLGLPTPGAAGAILGAFFIIRSVDSLTALKLFPILVILLSYLMVSKVRYPSFKGFELEGRRPFEYLVSITLLFCLVWILKPYREALLFLGFWGYVSYGLVMHFSRVSQVRESEELEAEEKEIEA